MLTDEEREALVKYRMEKAYATLTEAHDCARINHWTLAANRLYYAAYYASKALLIQNGIVAKSHEGVIGMIGQNFVVPGILSKDEAKLLARLQSMRMTGDYDDFMEWDEEEVEPLFSRVEDYINKIKTLVEHKELEKE